MVAFMVKSSYCSVGNLCLRNFCQVKRGGRVRTWKKRLFVLDSAGLSYYKTDQAYTHGYIVRPQFSPLSSLHSLLANLLGIYCMLLITHWGFAILSKAYCYSLEGSILNSLHIFRSQAVSCVLAHLQPIQSIPLNQIVSATVSREE